VRLFSDGEFLLAIIHTASRAEPSRAEPSRTEPIRLGKQTYVLKWKHSNCTPNRAEPNRTEPVHWLMSVFTRQPTTDSVAQ